MECVKLREKQAGLELKVYGDQCRVRHLCGAVRPEEVHSSFLSFPILVSDLCTGTCIIKPGVTGELEGGGGEGVGGPPRFVESGAGGDRRVGGAPHHSYSSSYNIYYISPLHLLPCFHFIILQRYYTV